MAWASRMELVAKNERIAAARERVEAEGGKWGRPSRFTKADLAKLEGLREAGRTIREIAVALKVPRSTVQRTLAQKVGRESGRGPAREATVQQG
jgi:DNA invertase Pin-like site-specific DNA recombinase